MVDLHRDTSKYKNGLTHIHYHVPFLKSVQISYHIKVGAAYENEQEQFGISHFLEHVVFNGSEKFPDAIKRDKLIASLGVYLNAWTWSSETVYHAISSRASLVEAFDIMHDTVFHPLLEGKSVEKEIGIIQEERLMSENNPGRSLYQAVWFSLMEGSTYAHPTLGVEESIANMNAKLLRKFHTDHYTPSNIVLVTYGGVSFTEIDKIASKLLSDLPEREAPVHSSVVNVIPTSAEKTKTAIVLEQDVQIEFYQRQYKVRKFTKLEDAVYSYLLQTVLSKGYASILYQKLQMENSLVSSMGLSINQFFDTSQITFDSQQESKNSKRVQLAVEEILKDLPGLISEDTFQRAKSFAIGMFIRNLESVSYPTSSSLVNIERFNILTGNEYGINDISKLLHESNVNDMREFAEEIFSKSESREGILLPLPKS